MKNAAGWILAIMFIGLVAVLGWVSMFTEAENAAAERDRAAAVLVEAKAQAQDNLEQGRHDRAMDRWVMVTLLTKANQPSLIILAGCMGLVAAGIVVAWIEYKR